MSQQLKQPFKPGWGTAALLLLLLVPMFFFPEIIGPVFFLLVILFFMFRGRRPPENPRAISLATSDSASAVHQEVVGQDVSSATPASPGTSLKCIVCGHDQFSSRYAQLNTMLASFVGLDWANRSARCEICTRCGYIHWFQEWDTQGTLKVKEGVKEGVEATSPPEKSDP